MPVVQLPSTPKGLSFKIAELTLIQNWSAENNLRMVVRLDHGTEAEAYEEVMAFHVGDSRLCRWIMWRDADSVFIQPLIGRIERYLSVAEAFEALAAKQQVVLTDIKPTSWPT
jgi:hypothetical protein